MVNIKGNNQFKKRDGPSPAMAEGIESLLRERCTKEEIIARLKGAPWFIDVGSVSLLKKRMKELKIDGVRKRVKSLSVVEQSQAVMDEVEVDFKRKEGIMTVLARLRAEGVFMTAPQVRDIMNLLYPADLQRRIPTFKPKIVRTTITAVGPNEHWSIDGHDKLTAAIGSPVYGIRDKTGRMLSLKVVKSNRKANVIARVYLDLIIELGGMAVQNWSDRGTETSVVFALANGLREVFAPDMDPAVTPPHLFMSSPRNIPIERSWQSFIRLAGDNLKAVWEQGKLLGCYNPLDPLLLDLHNWIMSTFAQDYVDKYQKHVNTARVRYQKEKAMPSGTSYDNIWFSPDLYDMANWLIEVDVDVVKAVRDSLPPETEDEMRFVSREREAMFLDVMTVIGNPKITINNIWSVYKQMEQILVSTRELLA